MRLPLAASAGLALLLLCAAPARAMDPAQHVKYQDKLLKRPLLPADTVFCDGRLGAESAKNKTDYDKCHVTRNFLADINTSADTGFPPMADIKYTKNQAEMSAIVDRLGKYGG